MLDGVGRFDADKAYKDSKLCNVLTGRELAQRLNESGCTRPVLAWSPGLVIPRSRKGFFRTSRRENPIVLALFSLVARDLLRVKENIENAGRLLARLATSNQERTNCFQYWCNELIRPGQHRFRESEISEVGRDCEKAKNLWQLSEQLIQESIH